MPLEIWLAFVIASALVLTIPGPTIFTVVSYAFVQGQRAHLPLVAAVTLGDATAIGLSLWGLGTLLANSAFWFTVVKWLGALYLLYLGIKLLRAGIRPTDPTLNPAAQPLHWLFINTYVVTTLNPKSIMFFIAFLPQFISPEYDLVQQSWILMATFVGLAGLNALLFATFAASAGQALTSATAQRWLNIAGGSLLSIAGVYTLLARRTT